MNATALPCWASVATSHLGAEPSSELQQDVETQSGSTKREERHAFTG